MESSAVVAALLERDLTVMKPPPAGTQYVTSALTLAEAGRAIIRARAGRLTRIRRAGGGSSAAHVRTAMLHSRRGRAVLDRVSRLFPSNRSARWMRCTSRPSDHSARRRSSSRSSLAMQSARQRAGARLHRRVAVGAKRTKFFLFRDLRSSFVSFVVKGAGRLKAAPTSLPAFEVGGVLGIARALVVRVRRIGAERAAAAGERAARGVEARGRRALLHPVDDRSQRVERSSARVRRRSVPSPGVRNSRLQLRACSGPPFAFVIRS